MSLDLDIAAALPELQAEAESRMVDTCTISRVTTSGEPIIDPVTLALTTPSTVVYSGKCRVQVGAAMAAQPEAGERIVTVARTTLHVPVSVTGIEVGDEATITASRDADLTGRLLRVRSLSHKTDLTARRLECEETQ